MSHYFTSAVTFVEMSFRRPFKRCINGFLSLSSALLAHTWLLRRTFPSKSLRSMKRCPAPRCPMICRSAPALRASPAQGYSTHPPYRRRTEYQLFHQQTWLCFFSPSGTKAVEEELRRKYPPACRCDRGGFRTAAIGSTTAKAIREAFGTEPDAIASSPCAVSLYDAIDRTTTSPSP